MTNNFITNSERGANIKERWQIETFFKTLKQLMKVKTFVGTTLNAVFIQIWTALGIGN